MAFGGFGSIFNKRVEKPTPVIQPSETSEMPAPVVPETKPLPPVLVRNDFRSENSYRAEGIRAYQQDAEENPYRPGTREAQFWQKGFLEEHERAARWPQLPDWIDRAQWNLGNPTSHLYQIQNVLLIMGDEGPSGGMAALRGLPSEPPKWLIKEAWDRCANSRYMEAKNLERFCRYDSAIGIKQMYDRENARKLCPHEFIDVMKEGAPTGERVCPRCGTLESLVDI